MLIQAAEGGYGKAMPGLAVEWARSGMAQYQKAAAKACLKIEEMTNFWPEGDNFKEKTARQSRD